MSVLPSHRPLARFVRLLMLPALVIGLASCMVPSTGQGGRTGWGGNENQTTRSTGAMAEDIAVPAVMVEVTPGASPRYALLVGVSDYMTPAWSIAAVGPTLETVRAGLAGSLGIADDAHHMRVLTGATVSTDLLTVHIEQIRRALMLSEGSREDRLVVVYWIGHGWTDGKGALRLLLPASDSQAPYTPNLPLSSLQSLLQPLHDAARVVTVLEACRIHGLAPPPPATISRITGLTGYSCGNGQIALAPADDAAPIYTQAWLDALRFYTRRETFNLVDVFEQARTTTIAQTVSAQVPEHLVAEDSWPVTQAAVSRVIVRVVDAEFPATTLANAEINWAGEPWPSDADEVGVNAAPGTYPLNASCDGYLRRETIVTIPPVAGSVTVTLPLLPAFTEIAGQAPGWPDGTVVRLASPRPAGWIEAYHQEETTVVNGQYHLRVPSAAPGMRLTLDETTEAIGTRGADEIMLDVGEDDPLDLDRVFFPQILGPSFNRPEPPATPEPEQPEDTASPGSDGTAQSLSGRNVNRNTVEEATVEAMAQALGNGPTAREAARLYAAGMRATTLREIINTSEAIQWFILRNPMYGPFFVPVFEHYEDITGRSNGLWNKRN